MVCHVPDLSYSHPQHCIWIPNVLGMLITAEPPDRLHMLLMIPLRIGVCSK
jgi:hypothetical protein